MEITIQMKDGTPSVIILTADRDELWDRSELLRDSFGFSGNVELSITQGNRTVFACPVTSMRVEKGEDEPLLSQSPTKGA